MRLCDLSICIDGSLWLPALPLPTFLKWRKIAIKAATGDAVTNCVHTQPSSISKFSVNL